MKILLIQPKSGSQRGILTPPLALLFVGEAARQAGHEVKIVDRNIEFFSKKFIKKFKPDVVGVSVFTGPLIKDAVEISKFIKRELGSGTKIVWGGIHPSLLPEQTISNDFIDFLVIGEGEVTFVELLDALENKKKLSEVKGICYKENGKIIRTPDREFIRNLDILPFINWSLIRAKKYLDLEIVLVTSRGCPYNCYFCYNQEYNRRMWRSPSAERVLEEIKRLEKITKNRHLKFHDDNFTVNRKRFFEIMKGLSKDYSLYIETRAEYVNEEFLEALKKFRKVWLFIDVESGSERLLRKMNKNISLDKVKEAFTLTRKYKNIFTTASVILGLPSETYEESIQTIKFVKSLKPDWITYCLFTPYPGSYFYNELVEHGELKPPSSTLEWASYTPDIQISDLRITNLSKLSNKELKKINLESWIKVFINIILKGDFHKIYRFMKNAVLTFPSRFFSIFGLD
jgi:radical SAM superfamily enzyme YgiQ (UPF0313 family)